MDLAIAYTDGLAEPIHPRGQHEGLYWVAPGVGVFCGVGRGVCCVYSHSVSAIDSVEYDRHTVQHTPW
jgi:hypothetical protein